MSEVKEKRNSMEENEEKCKSTQDAQGSPSEVHTKNSLIRSNDLLTHTSTDTLLEMLKDYAGVKEISEETTVHLSMVQIKFSTMT